MVSQKSMARVGSGVTAYEQGIKVPEEETAKQIARHLNRIVSRLVESDQQVNPRELELWRGMAAGTQAQGSWQNAKGQQAELLVKGLVMQRLRDADWLRQTTPDGTRFQLRDGRIVAFADEPDIAFSKDNQIRAAVEVKGGIDPAGVLERLGAALKSLRRAREQNPTAVTILIIQSSAVTEQAKADLDLNRHIITHWFAVEDLLSHEAARERLFELLSI